MQRDQDLELAAALLAEADALAASGRLPDAETAYRAAVRHKPDDAEAHLKLGNLLLRMDRADEALPLLRAAAVLNPTSAVIHCHIGLALLELQQADEAIVALREALRLRPEFPEALATLAETLRRSGQLAEARQAAEAAIKADFAKPEAHLHFGNVLGDLGEFVEASNAYRRALGLRPGDPAVMSNLGIALYTLGQLPEALAQHRMALSLRPESAAFRYNFAVALLAVGELREGWAAYESRLQLGLPSSVPLDVVQPRWTGEALAGRTIFLYGEQGLGDTLQFVRYAPLVAERGGRVVLSVPAPLVRLLRRMPGVAQVVPADAPLPEFDLHCPLLSLPHVFGTQLESVPASIPYLAADPLLVEAWQARLSRDGRQDVGLVWAGNPRADQPSAAFVDRRRSIALERFAPLATVPGVRYLSLQKGSPASQLENTPRGLQILDLMDQANDFADTAALLAHLDLVITVDTSVAHLAGALGKPVWMLSRYDACWRWLRNRSDSPWYPTMRIYRQPRLGDWDTVIARVAADLGAWSQQRRKTRGARPVPAAAAN